MRRLTAFLLSLPVTFLIALQLPARAICTPMPEVVSWATLHGECVAANVARYLLSLAAAVALALVLRARPVPQPPPPAARAARIDPLLLFLALVVVFNAGLRVSLAAPLVDTFHEGEALAFGPAFSRPEPFLHAAMVHGFGTDVLPDLLGRRLFPGSPIAGMRLFRTAEAILFFAGLLWALFEIAAYEDDLRRRRAMRLVAAGLALPLLSLAGFEHELLRKSFAMLQLASMLRAMRTDRGALWVLLGASVVPAIFYNYAEGFAAALVLGVTLIAARRRRIVWVAAGGAVTAGLAVAWVGLPQLREIVRQISYWGQLGGRTWMLPIGQEWPQVAFLFAPLVAAQALALTQLRRDRPELWLCLLASLSGFRLWTDRADDFHLAIAAAASLPLVFALVLRGLPPPRPAPSRLPPWLLPAALLALGLVPIAPFDTLGVVRLGRTVAAAAREAQTPDSAIVAPSYLAAAAALRPTAGKCIFTLTSEGVWYHLLDRPSCSRFHHLIYARTPEVQEEIVAALEREKPSLLVVDNPFWSNRIDGVPVSATNAIVWRYVMLHYRPDRVVGTHALYRRADRAVSR